MSSSKKRPRRFATEAVAVHENAQARGEKDGESRDFLAVTRVGRYTAQRQSSLRGGVWCDGPMLKPQVAEAATMAAAVGFSYCQSASCRRGQRLAQASFHENPWSRSERLQRVLREMAVRGWQTVK